MKEKKRKKNKKRKISKISIFLIILVWIIALIFTLVLLINGIRNKSKLKEITSQIKIPEGFYYVGGKIDTGVVISDDKQDELKGTEYKNLSKLKGNQFVWVPVEKAIVSNFEEAEQLVNEGKNPIAIKYKNEYKSIDYAFDSYLKKYIIIEENYQNDESREPYILKSEKNGDSEEYIEGSTKDLYQISFNKMVESVEKNKGFYISRFEAGNINDAVTNDEKVVSKANDEDITYQSWIDLYKVIGNMYDRDDITTEMIWGCQWNAILFWFNSNPDTQRYAFSLENKGNYSGKLCKTGSEEKYSINNIYDLFGNVAEWTQANSFGSYRVAKGASYNGISSNSIAVNDLIEDPLNSFKYIGTRAVLYIY